MRKVTCRTVNSNINRENLGGSMRTYWRIRKFKSLEGSLELRKNIGGEVTVR